MCANTTKRGLILAFLCASSLAAPPYRTKVYRSDYTYNKNTDAFYKLHTETHTTFRARQKCEAEGAKLMVAYDADITQLHGMFKRFPDLGDYVLVEWDRREHMLEGSSGEHPMIIMDQEPGVDPPTCEVVTRSGEIESADCSQKAPFMCKVEAMNAPYDEDCGVFGNNYINKISTVGSCYKVPRIVYSWNEALAECEAEGAHLVVLNSETEREVVKGVMHSVPSVDGTTTSWYWFFFAGIRANHPTDGTPRVFRTIMNQTLEEAGYNQWSDNEPNNFEDSEYCGSVFKNDGKYNDINCAHEYAFICEKERRAV